MSKANLNWYSASHEHIETSHRFDKLVDQYIKLRDRIAELESRIAEFKHTKAKVAGVMLELLDATGQESARTAVGTISAVVKATASLEDPDAFMVYVRSNDAYELMDRRANSTACQDYQTENGTLPPGVKLNVTRTISVRKST